MNKSNFSIITFYEFKNIDDLDIQKIELKKFCLFNKLRGTVILAKEGINGSIAGSSDSISKFISYLGSQSFKNLELKFSYYKYMPFNRLKIKSKKEIVTFKSQLTDPEIIKGNYIPPKDWNSTIKDNGTILIDVRNHFEFKMGSFENAINPKTKSFSEFKKFVDNHLSNFKEKKLAIFCTGGIRCEKASSYMINSGFKNVNQLKGGILKYLEEIPKKDSKWKGECFVFDNRVSLKNELKEGSYSLCYGCRQPLARDDKSSKHYISGISCHNCFDKTSLEKKKNLLERNKQITIAKKRGVFNRYIKQSILEYE